VQFCIKLNAELTHGKIKTISNMQISQLETVLYAAIALPVLEAGFLAYLWQGTLTRPWLFFISGTLIEYVLMAAFISSIFSNIGTFGAQHAAPEHLADQMLFYYLSRATYFLIAGFLLLVVLRWVIRRWSSLP